jgi:hypothetical protein
MMKVGQAFKDHDILQREDITKNPCFSSSIKEHTSRLIDENIDGIIWPQHEILDWMGFELASISVR